MRNIDTPVDPQVPGVFESGRGGIVYIYEGVSIKEKQEFLLHPFSIVRSTFHREFPLKTKNILRRFMFS